MKATIVLSILILATSSILFWVFTIYGPQWTEHVVARNPQAQIEKARALREQGRLQEAIERFRKAADLAPENPKYWYELGTALNAAGRPEEAIEYIERAIEILPGYLADQPAQTYDKNWIMSLYFQGISRSYEQMGQLDEAIYSTERAADILMNHNNRLQALQRLIELLARAERYEDLERRTREAVAIAPGEARYHYLLARSLQANEGDAEEALDAIDRAIALEDLPVYFRLKADILLETGQPEKALGSLEEGLYRDVDNPDLLARAVEISRQTGQEEKAATWMERLRELAADDPAARNRLKALQSSTEPPPPDAPEPAGSVPDSTPATGSRPGK